MSVCKVSLFTFETYKHKRFMKKLFTLLCFGCVLFMSSSTVYGQDADEIINNYIETIGGADQLEKMKSVKMTGKASSFGMEFPITIINQAPGKMKMTLVFQGKELTQMAFDGETAWTTNMMTMEPEKMEAEQTEIFKQTMDFPDPLLNYKDKGYTVSLEGEKEIEGTPCHKIKLSRGTVKVDGKDENLETFYYFDKESLVPIMQEDYALIGEMKGKSTETYFSDYDEVDGLIFPFTMVQKIDGQVMMEGTMEVININPEIETNAFAFPEK